jgi:hypothetical protein
MNHLIREKEIELRWIQQGNVKLLAAGHLLRHCISADHIFPVSVEFK